MFPFLLLANARVLVALNHWASSSPALYQLLLFMTERGSDLLMLATFVVLWFWPQERRRQYLQAYPEDEMVPREAKPGGWWAQRCSANELSRAQSRAQLLVLGLAGVLGYITALMISTDLGVARPFISVLPIRAGVPDAFAGLRAYGSFPAEYAVLLGALPAALFFWDRALAYLWLALGLLLGAVRVAVGFNAPFDMAGGAAIGALYACGGLILYHRHGAFERTVSMFARGFDRRATPYCYILYALVALVAVEFLLHFPHVSDALLSVRGELLVRFSRG